MYDITAIGEILIDFTPAGRSGQGGQLYEQNPGGAPGNVAVACAKLGGTAAFIGKVGTDAFGEFLRNTLEVHGVDTKGLVFTDQARTTLAFVHLHDDGDRSFSFYRNPGADMLLRTEDVGRSLIDDCRIFHFGSVSLSAGSAAEATIDAVGYARNRGKTVSFDVNYRAPLFRSESAAISLISAALPYADILKVSQEEMTLLTGETDPVIGSEKLFGGASLVLVSMGSQGAFYRNGNTCGQVDTFKVNTVDTTGAGDAFFGAVLYQLRNMSPDKIRYLDGSALDDIVRFANAAGALSTTKKGAIPSLPTQAEIQALLSGNRHSQ
jgi:fructokinase